MPALSFGRNMLAAPLDRICARFGNAIRALILLFISATAVAQTPAALPLDLQLYTNGIVWTSVRQANGGIIFGGHFSKVNGVARDNIARLNPDGTLDTNWGLNGIYFNVHALAIDGKDNLYIGSAAGLQKFAATSGVREATWKPAIFGQVYAIGFDSKGNIYAGGNFNASRANGFNAGSLVRISSSGVIDETWLPQASGVYALAIDANDNVYAGGQFSTIGGQPRNSLAKIPGDGSGTADATWNPALAASSGTTQLSALALDGNGSLYVGGAFDSVGGQTRGNIAKVATSGTGVIDANWNPASNGTVRALAYGGNGKLYVGGSFTFIGNQQRTDLARLSVNGGGEADADWNASADSIASDRINTISIAQNGIFAGGFFSTIGGMARHSFASISIDGRPGNVADTTSPATVNAIAVQADGGIIVGGYFSGAGNFIRNNVLRVLPDGTIDPNWDAPTDVLNDPFISLGIEAVAADNQSGAVYIGGQFAHVGGQQHTGVAKISPSGSVDPSWGPSTSLGGTFAYDWLYGVEAIAVGANGDVYLGGDFGLIGGQKRTGLAKISASGLLDPTWDPAATVSLGDYGIRSIGIDTDGSIFVCGSFSIRGKYVPGLAKLSGTGAGQPDAAWTPNGWFPATLQLDHQGSLYVAGSSVSAGGGAILKLSANDGAKDPNWQHQVSGDLSRLTARGFERATQIYALALGANGEIYAGGIFSLAGNHGYEVISPRSRPYLAKFSAVNGVPVDVGWNPLPDDAVYALVTDGKGTLYAGGIFSQIGPQSHSSFAAIPEGDAANPLIADHLNQFGWTGAWYNPATSGQGILLQIIPGQDSASAGTLFGGWFTYDPTNAGPGTGQRWYTLQGPVDVTAKTVGLQVYATVPVSNAPFYVGPVTQVGDALLTFSDCSHGTLTYTVSEPPTAFGASAVGNGTIALTRLGSNPACSPTGDLPYPGDFLLSGAWRDPSVPFSGFVFDVDPKLNIFFAAWYRNIDTNKVADIASRRWYTIQAPYTTGFTSLDNMPIYLATGGVFAAPSLVTTTQVGTAKIVFANCANATLTYSFASGPDAGTNGTLNLSRGVAKPAGCNP